jgi:hypothetical protein
LPATAHGGRYDELLTRRTAQPTTLAKGVEV